MAESPVISEAANGAPLVGGPLRVHSPDVCAGQRCVLHAPGDHHMSRWPIFIRLDKGALAERVCVHHVGHPDPDSVRFLIRETGDTHWRSHGCDGCCRPPERDFATA